MRRWAQRDKALAAKGFLDVAVGHAFLTGALGWLQACVAQVQGDKYGRQFTKSS